MKPRRQATGIVEQRPIFEHFPPGRFKFVNHCLNQIWFGFPNPGKTRIHRKVLNFNCCCAVERSRRATCLFCPFKVGVGTSVNLCGPNFWKTEFALPPWSRVDLLTSLPSAVYISMRHDGAQPCCETNTFTLSISQNRRSVFNVITLFFPLVATEDQTTLPH